MLSIRLPILMELWGTCSPSYTSALYFHPSHMVWSKIAQVFSFGSQWGDNTVQLVEGNDASAMLKRVEGILEDSMRALSSHERLLSEGEFITFSVKHRNLLLKVFEVKKAAHLEQNRGLLSTRTSEGQPYHIDQEVYRLYTEARIYQRDVLTASRRAKANEHLAVEKLNRTESTPDCPNSPESSDPATTWYSVIAPSTRSSTDTLTQSDVDSETSTLVDHKPYLAIARVRPHTFGLNDPEESTENETYREILILESNEKTIVMFNPNLRYLNKEPDPLDEMSLLEMSRAGEALLHATNPQKLQGYEVVGNQHETSWVDSFVNTLSRLGVGIGAEMM
ncbi:hypothetical protein OPQ81_003852 [Rhizoctonia solani]|nr:hypothetical protein OPQ81_003852 [Rhizoctonia solani]